MNEKFYAIRQSGKNADLYLFGDIAEIQIWEEDVTPTSILQELRELKAEEITVYINSYGGSVSAAWAIYTELLKHPAKITTYAAGFVASAALYPFLAGERRIASETSAFYLHQVSGSAEGYAGDLRAAADTVEKMTEIGVNAFVERAGMERETVLRLMEAETWLDPQEALAHGIATEIDREKNGGPAQSVRRAVIQRLTGGDSPGPAGRHHTDTAPKSGLMELLAGKF